MALDPNDLPYRSPRSLSLMAIGGIAAFTLCQLASAVLGVAQINNPGAMTTLEPDKPTSVWIILQAFVAVLQFPIYVFAAVTFLMWLFRLYKNLPALRAESPDFSPGWAVGWWFVPLFNLFRPFQAVRRVWAASDPDFDPEPRFLTSLQPAAPFFMSSWWAFWLIANIFTNISARLFDPSDTESLATGGYGFLLGGIFWTAAAAFAIKLLLDITARQELRFVNVKSLPIEEPPPPPVFEPDREEI